MMRALVCNTLGSTDDLVIEDRPALSPAAGEVVVDVRAAGINFPDILVIAGKYQDKAEPPFIPGNEAAGIVSAVGEGVSHLAVGDRVIAMPRGGAFAEQIAVDAGNVAPLPDALDFDIGAGFGVTYGTSYHALKQCARLKASETVLVLGAAGGVGIAAVEIAKAMGARVIAAASSAEKLEFARQSGADEVFDYSSDGLKVAVREMTDGKGADVVVDPVGGAIGLEGFRALGWHGRHLVIGFASGDIPAFPGNLALLKEASVVGVWWGTWLKNCPAENVENLAELGAWLADGTLKPAAVQTFALDDFKEAFRQLSERRALGKVVFSMGPSSN